MDTPLSMTDTPPIPQGDVYTVTSLSHLIKGTLESTFGRIRVSGEVSGAKQHTSGHLYFSLKDEGAVLDCVCWRMTVGRLPMKIQDGMAVVCTGRVTTYGGRSKYQLIVDAITPAGEGALLKLLEDRRRALAAEGVFDDARKKPLPFLPDVIGLITSPTGAVIQDILHRLSDRFPRRVLLWPVLVQGEGAAAQIAEAIRGMNRLDKGGPIPRPDVLIVARGGGSLEDLWAFNEECVVRATWESDIPLVSAVGHETDTTLIDYAADLRAPTPTAAAEKVVPVRAALGEWLAGSERRIHRAHQRLWEDRYQRLDDRSDRLRRGIDQYLTLKNHQITASGGRLPHPRQVLFSLKDRLEQWSGRLHRGARTFMVQRDTMAAALFRELDAYAYHRVLQRGFTMVRTKNEAGGQTRYIGSVQDVGHGLLGEIVFHDGVRSVRIDGDGGRCRGKG